jgi:hypothetical protein
MPKTTDLADLTREIARLLDLQGTRPFDGHLVVTDVQPGKGTITGRVLAAHDSADLLTFTVAVAL